MVNNIICILLFLNWELKLCLLMKVVVIHTPAVRDNTCYELLWQFHHCSRDLWCVCTSETANASKLNDLNWSQWGSPTTQCSHDNKFTRLQLQKLLHHWIPGKIYFLFNPILFRHCDSVRIHRDRKRLILKALVPQHLLWSIKHPADTAIIFKLDAISTSKFFHDEIQMWKNFMKNFTIQITFLGLLWGPACWIHTLSSTVGWFYARQIKSKNILPTH